MAIANEAEPGTAFGQNDSFATLETVSLFGDGDEAFGDGEEAKQPHLGVRNQGRRPIETIRQFVSRGGREDN